MTIGQQVRGMVLGISSSRAARSPKRVTCAGMQNDRVCSMRRRTGRGETGLMLNSENT